MDIDRRLPAGAAAQLLNVRNTMAEDRPPPPGPRWDEGHRGGIGWSQPRRDRHSSA
jgi:hypothetical protein